VVDANCWLEGKLAPLKQSLHTGSNPVLTAGGANPETLKNKVGDSSERRAFLINQ